MGIFGWSLPPGCGTLPGEEDEGPCEVCGQAIDDCICPECPKCGTIGDPNCYQSPTLPGHGLIRTEAQIAGRAALEQIYKEQAEACRAEAEYWADPERKREEEAFHKLMAEERGRE